MIFKIGDKFFDPNETPCAIVFADDEELQAVVKILQDMKPKPKGLRWFTAHPSDSFKTSEEYDKWAEIDDSVKFFPKVKEGKEIKHEL